MDLLLFDLDGTLVDSRKDIANAVNAVLRRRGYEEIEFDFIVGSIGQGVTHLLRRCLEHLRIPAEELKAVKAAFMEEYRENLVVETTMYPGVPETLEGLSDCRKAIITNKPHALAVSLLEQLGLAEHFALVLGGDSVRHKKPAPDALIQAMQHFTADQRSTMMIGDSIYDLEAARAAGVRSVAALYGFQKETLLRSEGADYYIHNFPALAGIIGVAA